MQPTYIVVIDRPYYPTVHYAKTMEEVESIKARLLEEHSEFGEHNSTITVALVLDEDHIKTDY